MAAVTMRLSEIGHQLRAFRLESGMRADEIAARLGVSRAALYRYEKGEVIKLDTVQRLAELLKVSPLTLLGIGVEYYSRSIGFFERVRQIEEEADQILQIADPVCYLVTSGAYDEVLAKALAENMRYEKSVSDNEFSPERQLGILMARKVGFAERRPTVITMLPENAVERFLARGVGESIAMSDELRDESRVVAAREIESIINLIESEPIGLQFSLVSEVESTTSCMLMRGRERMMLAINPFRSDANPFVSTGVSLVTSAPEAVNSHQRVIESLWRDSIKGKEAASRLRALLAANAIQ